MSVGYRYGRERGLVSTWNVVFQETNHASRRHPGRRGRWWRSAMELRVSGMPGSAKRRSRTPKHPGFDRVQRRRRALVPGQCVAGSAPTTDRDEAAASEADGQLRHSPIAGVILTNGEVDAVAGLLSMREGSPFTVYAHAKVLAILKSNSIFNVLEREQGAAAADRDGPGVRAVAARRLAIRHRDFAVRSARQGRLVSGRQGSPRRQ